MLIRLAIESDLPAINDIYNQSISTGYSTCDTTPVSIEERTNWFHDHDKILHPVFVAEINKQIIGWISISPYRRGRQALAKTVEVSYFIDKNFQGRGIGSELMRHTLEHAKKVNHKNVFAILLESNKVSIALLKKFNFKQWGHLPGVAIINGKSVGQVYYGKAIYP